MTNRKCKAFFLFMLITVMVFSLSACGKDDSGQNASVAGTQESGVAADRDDIVPKETSDAATANEMAESDNSAGGSSIAEGNRILIAYFTAAENSGVDAVSSASYTTINGEAVGRVQAVAEMIQEQVGGELFSIRTSIVYPADGGALIDQAAEEQEDDIRPELTAHIENFEDYDVIFVGYPNWWFDMPMVMYSFFDEYDFSGKTIIPFNVHNGSRFSGTIGTIQDLEPEAVVIEDGFTVSERDVADAGEDVAEWLQDLGY